MRRSTFGSRHWRPLPWRANGWHERDDINSPTTPIRHRGAHHLRHAFATLMLGDKVPLHAVSKMLGHAQPSITADLYAHAIPDQIEEAGASQRRLFG